MFICPVVLVTWCVCVFFFDSRRDTGTGIEPTQPKQQHGKSLQGLVPIFPPAQAGRRQHAENGKGNERFVRRGASSWLRSVGIKTFPSAAHLGNGQTIAVVLNKV